MATFKVGQRVRVIGTYADKYSYLVGHEGIIVGRGPTMPYLVDLPTAPPHPAGAYGPTQWQFEAHNLAPLTDPKADEFIERVKKWKPEPQPVALPERQKSPT